ncbi:hypothetical protein [Cohnella rhizosphaerae]|uniref:CBM-cenC domain-containing protein n=1 Tax=Cohnella rhizosphaerae TaxID=1457232 RepID=A0A9X4L6E6_9BACL|nr:hypothetical protein [Cohnella rhizosphaerae]MDG0814342.1 hypothetical protein [Cohnella rhizosphaerae]
MHAAIRGLTMMLIALMLLGGVAGPVLPASAYYAETDYPHAGTELVGNGSMESVSGGSAGGWIGWYAGYTVDSSVSRSGSRSLSCELTGAGECGGYQFISLNRTEAKPLKIVGWSKAQNVSGGVSTDYSLWVDLTYTDNTHLYGEAKGFQTGTHDWEKAEMYIDPEKPVKEMTAYLLMRGKTGKVWFDDVSVQELPAGLLANGAFETVASGKIAGWGEWQNGYTVAAGGRKRRERRRQSDECVGNRRVRHLQDGDAEPHDGQAAARARLEQGERGCGNDRRFLLALCGPDLFGRYA